VLFVTSAYPEGRDDARGIFIQRIARGLVREGLEVTVLAPGTPSAPQRSLVDGVPVERAPYWVRSRQRLATGLGGIVPNLRAHPGWALQVPSLVGALVRGALRLASAADIVHAHWTYPAGIAGVAAAKRHHIPLVVTSHGGDLNLTRRSRLLRSVSGRVARAADACVAVSDDLAEQFRSLGLAPEQISVIPYGVDLIEEATGDAPIAATVPDELLTFDGFRLIYVGSLIPRKSVQTVLEAHHRLQSSGRVVCSVIVGDGPDRANLERLARARSLDHVWFVESQPPVQVPRWLSIADALVLPSRSEGRPNVVLEAMAAGVPVLATDIPGTRELVREGETGLLFPVGDSQALADCVDRLIDSPDAARLMGERSRVRVELDRLTTAHIAKSHIALYERVIKASIQ
jgi:L-malate glycosyltransferase